MLCLHGPVTPAKINSCQAGINARHELGIPMQPPQNKDILSNIKSFGIMSSWFKQNDVSLCRLRGVLAILSEFHGAGVYGNSCGFILLTKQVCRNPFIFLTVKGILKGEMQLWDQAKNKEQLKCLRLY